MHWNRGPRGQPLFEQNLPPGCCCTQPKGLWSDFKTAFFLIKIQIENYLKPPFLILSAGKWVRVDNIRSTWSVLWCFGHSQGALEYFGSFLQVELFWGEMVHTEPNWCPKMGPEWAKIPWLVYFNPVKCFWLIRNISVHHLRCLAISASRTLISGEPWGSNFEYLKMVFFGVRPKFAPF